MRSAFGCSYKSTKRNIIRCAGRGSGSGIANSKSVTGSPNCELLTVLINLFELELDVHTPKSEEKRQESSGNREGGPGRSREVT